MTSADKFICTKALMVSIAPWKGPLIWPPSFSKILNLELPLTKFRMHFPLKTSTKLYFSCTQLSLFLLCIHQECGCALPYYAIPLFRGSNHLYEK